MINKRDCRLLSNYRIERESKYTDRNTANSAPYILHVLIMLSSEHAEHLYIICSGCLVLSTLNAFPCDIISYAHKMVT